jgi:hypothetical protein
MASSSSSSCSSSSDEMVPSFIKVILIDCIFQEVQDFLDHSKTDINNILNVSRKFKLMKKSSFYWKMNKKYSLEYNSNVLYRLRVDSLLTNKNTQLSLNLFNCNTISDVSTLGNVHTLKISGCHGITDVSSLGNVQVLSFNNCSVRVRVNGQG